MAIDPTLALQTQPFQNQFNPLANMQQAQQFQANALAIQSGQQQLVSQNALGRAAQGAINSDGSFNSNAFMQAVHDDPDARFGALQGIQEGQKTAGGQYSLNQDALGQTSNRVNAIGSGMSGLLSNPNLTSSDVINAVASQANAGKPAQEFVTSVLPTMPTQRAGEDPQSYSGRLHTWVAGVAGQSAGPAAALQAFTPSVATMDTGGSVNTFDSNANTNAGATNITARKTFTPEGAATPVPGPVGTQGQQTTMSRAAYAAQNGLGNLVAGGSPFGTGRPGGMPSSLLNPNRPGAAGSGAGVVAPSVPTTAAGVPAGVVGVTGAGSSPGGAPGGTSGIPGPMVTQLGAGQEAGLQAAGKASADQWAALQNQVGGTAAGGGSAGRIYQLQSALGDLQSLGQQGSGPGSQVSQKLVSVAQTLPFVGGLVAGVSTPQQIANYDLANKYLTAYGSARAGAHGATTDSQLATTLAGNANVHISNLAAQDVVKANIGLERMDQAQASAFQNAKDPQTGQPLSPDQFSNFSANWNKTMDPRAFIVPELSPAQVQKSIAGMSPADRTKFQSTYNTAVQNGWISPPAWATPTPAQTIGGGN